MATLSEPSIELLDKCRKGSKSAFAEIFHGYKSYAYNLIYKITGPCADHEDLLQDAFFQVYLSLRTFKGDSSFKTWFHRIVVHACTRHWRHINTAKRISPRDTVSYEEFEFCINSSEKGNDHQTELRDLVDKALAQLDISLKIPLVLHVYSDMDLCEIGSILGIPEGTVKSRLFTARKKLKTCLDTLEP